MMNTDDLLDCIDDMLGDKDCPEYGDIISDYNDAHAILHSVTARAKVLIDKLNAEKKSIE